MTRPKAEFIQRSRRVLGLAILGTSMALSGCSGKSPKLEDDDSNSEDENSSSDDNKKSNTPSDSASADSSGSGPKGSNDGSNSESNSSSSSEKLPDPTSLEAEIAFKGDITVEGKLSLTVDVELGLAEQGGTIGDNFFHTELTLTNGTMKVTIPPPGKDIDLGDAGGKFAGVASLLGTVYDDVNSNGAYDKGERVIGTLTNPISYAKPGNAPGYKEWQIIDNGMPVDIDGPLEVFRLDQIEAVKTLDVGGKIANLGVDVSHLSSLTFDEVNDLKTNFNATGRPIGFKLDKTAAAWTSKLAEGLDDSRRRMGGYPMLPGFKNPGVEFPIGYLETAENGGELKPDTKYTHLCISEMGGQRFSAFMLVWIEPGPDWVAERQGAFLAAYYSLNPGWNALGVYVVEDKDFVYFPLGNGQNNALVTSEKCVLRVQDAENKDDSTTGEMSTATGSSTSKSRLSKQYPDHRFRRLPVR